MAKHEFCRSLRVGRHIESFGVTNTGKRARRHIAYGIAACLPSGDSDCSKAAHQTRRVIDVNVVKLKVLASCDMKNAVGVLLGQICKRIQMVGRYASERDLDPLHA